MGGGGGGGAGRGVFRDILTAMLIYENHQQDVTSVRCASTLADVYHWRELPQVSFLSRQTRVCRDKTRLLSRQKYACRDKTVVATNTCMTNIICLPPRNIIDVDEN